MSNLLNASIKFLNKNASTILTCVGAVGVIVTSVMAVKATPKALASIEEATEEKGDVLSKWEAAQVAGPAYITSIISGTATVACIFGANILNKRTQAALTSAYALLDQTHRQYKHKLTELYGDDADTNIKTEIAKDNYDEEEYVDVYEDGKLLFYDQYSNRYYRATNEQVLRAEYELNKMLVEEYTASLNAYYLLLGIPKVVYGYDIGWSVPVMQETYWSSWINFVHTKVTMDDGIECTIIDFTDPCIDFDNN